MYAMKDLLPPLRTESLKDVFISRLEGLILSGKLSIGQKLPSERDLALQLDVSRPVVHEGLIDLANKGLITMKPRSGAVVNDFRREGSVTLLNSILKYNQGRLSPELLQGMIDMRRVLERETARLSALNRTERHLEELQALVEAESRAKPDDIDKLIEIDFRFHHIIALASGNIIYPLFINSLEHIYKNLSGVFFSNSEIVPVVAGLHRDMLDAIKKQDGKASMSVMNKFLDYGVQMLNAALKE